MPAHDIPKRPDSPFVRQPENPGVNDLIMPPAPVEHNLPMHDPFIEMSDDEIEINELNNLVNNQLFIMLRNEDMIPNDNTNDEQ